MIAGSRRTLLANLIQQCCAAALLLLLPNLLEKQAYAEVVFVGALLGFMAVADLGLLLVYGRIVPGMVVKGADEDIRHWDASIFGFGMLASALFSLLVSLIYWIKSGSAEHALALFFVPIELYCISFYVSRNTVTGDFSEYQRVTGIRAVASLVAIPMTALGGISAWFVSQIVAGALVIGYIGRRTTFDRIGRIDWSLVRENIPEGLMLCTITVAWLQLLNFARLYASFAYPKDLVAHYGIVTAAYQSLSTLLISAFLPVSVGVLGLLGKSDAEAFEFLKRALARSVWWSAIGVLLITETTPHIFAVIFPSYRFDGAVLPALLLGIVFYPFFILLGNCMIGTRRAGTYLLLILGSLGMSLLSASLTDSIHRGYGAAWGQLIGLATFTFSLFLVTRSLYGTTSHSTWRYLQRSLTATIVLLLLYLGVRMGFTDPRFITQ